MFRNSKTGRSMTDDFKQMAKDLNKMLNEVTLEAESKLEEIWSDSFESERYKGGKSSKWKGRKKPDKGDGSARKERRGLLVKEGDLIGSADTFHKGREAGIRTDVPYAQVHNEGLKAGRGKGFTMPERQFMPKPGEESKVVTKHLDKVIEEKMDKIMR